MFFGYTHCPDVCPATVGTVNEALAAVGDGPRVVFVSIDPERDDAGRDEVATSSTCPRPTRASPGRPPEVRTERGRLGRAVREDRDGLRRTATRWRTRPTSTSWTPRAGSAPTSRSGRTSAPIAAALHGAPRRDAGAVECPRPRLPRADRRRLATDARSAPPPRAGAPRPATARPRPGPSSRRSSPRAIWAGGPEPGDPQRRRRAPASPLDGTIAGPASSVTRRRHAAAGRRSGPWPSSREGETVVYYVATVAHPVAGRVALERHARPGATGSGRASNALDPGIHRAARRAGAQRPDTPTLADVGGVVRAVTTQPDAGPAAVADVHRRRARAGQAVRDRHRLGAVQGLAGVRPGAGR